MVGMEEGKRIHYLQIINFYGRLIFKAFVILNCHILPLADKLDRSDMLSADVHRQGSVDLETARGMKHNTDVHP